MLALPPAQLPGHYLPRMDHAEPLDVALEAMHVERLVRDDGRLLLLFTWGATSEPEAGESGTGDGPA